VSCVVIPHKRATTPLGEKMSSALRVTPIAFKFRYANRCIRQGTKSDDCPSDISIYRI